VNFKLVVFNITIMENYLCSRQESRISMMSSGRRSMRDQPTTRARKESVAKMAFEGMRLLTVCWLCIMVYSCETWSINRLDIRTLDIAFREIFNGFLECGCEITVILLLTSSYFYSVAGAKPNFFYRKCFAAIICY